MIDRNFINDTTPLVYSSIFLFGELLFAMTFLLIEHDFLETIKTAKRIEARNLKNNAQKPETKGAKNVIRDVVIYGVVIE